MKLYLIAGLAGSTLLGLYACSNNNSTPPLAGAFRVVNGISDSSGITASATSGFASTGAADFDTASSTVNPPDGGYNVQLFNNGSSNPFTTVNNVSIQHNNLTTLFTYGSIAAGTAGGFTAEENLSEPASGDFTLQFANDTTQAGAATLNIYLVKPGSGISGAQTVATATAASASQDVAVPAGTYEIIITDATGATVYDSGSTQSGIVLPTPDTNVIQIGALDATTTQAEPTAAGSGNYGSLITLLVMDNNGGETLHFNGQN